MPNIRLYLVAVTSNVGVGGTRALNAVVVAPPAFLQVGGVEDQQTLTCVDIEFVLYDATSDGVEGLVDIQVGGEHIREPELALAQIEHCIEDICAYTVDSQEREAHGVVVTEGASTDGVLVGDLDVIDIPGDLLGVLAGRGGGPVEVVTGEERFLEGNACDRQIERCEADGGRDLAEHGDTITSVQRVVGYLRRVDLYLKVVTLVEEVGIARLTTPDVVDVGIDATGDDIVSELTGVVLFDIHRDRHTRHHLEGYDTVASVGGSDGHSVVTSGIGMTTVDERLTRAYGVDIRTVARVVDSQMECNGAVASGMVLDGHLRSVGRVGIRLSIHRPSVGVTTGDGKYRRGSVTNGQVEVNRGVATHAVESSVDIRRVGRIGVGHAVHRPGIAVAGGMGVDTRSAAVDGQVQHDGRVATEGVAVGQCYRRCVGRVGIGLAIAIPSIGVTGDFLVHSARGVVDGQMESVGSGAGTYGVGVHYDVGVGTRVAVTTDSPGVGVASGGVVHLIIVMVDRKVKRGGRVTSSGICGGVGRSVGRLGVGHTMPLVSLTSGSGIYSVIGVVDSEVQGHYRVAPSRVGGGVGGGIVRRGVGHAVPCELITDDIGLHACRGRTVNIDRHRLLNGTFSIVGDGNRIGSGSEV